jgi:HAD superfamily hydrolase (TIGR01509 family)
MEGTAQRHGGAAITGLGEYDVTDGLEAVLFDMDGLLVDTEPLWFETETEVMARLGAPWAKEDQERLLGGSMEHTVGYLLAKATRPASPAEVARWMTDGMLRRAAAGRVVIRPGARELLRQVAAAQLPYALVTGSQREFTDAVLASTGLRFTTTVTGDDVTRTKPDPEPYLLAAKLLDADPGKCVALEDSPNGVASATSAGCRVIAVPSLLPIPPAAGRLVVPSLSDVSLLTLRALVALSLGSGVPNTSRDMSRWKEHLGGADMSYSSIAWLPLAAGLTILGLVLSYLAYRRRGVRPALLGVAWSLLPIAAYLTGAIEMLWKVGAAIGQFGTGFVFSPMKWAGIGVTGLAIALFLAAGGRRRRRAARDARKAARGDRKAEAGGGSGPPQLGARPRATAADAATRALSTELRTPVPAEPQAAAPAKAKRKSAPVDDDLKDIEEILRKRGI